MKRQIYHGSSHIVRKPEFGTGGPYNDFGLGFYCSEVPSYAAEWAVGPEKGGFVSAYSINTDGLRIINLCSSQYNALNWLAVLLSFRTFDLSGRLAHRAGDYISRHFPVDIQGCDCIIGYRADDICFSLAQDLLDGRISYPALSGYLRSRDSNREFVLKSNRAFESVSFSGFEAVLPDPHYPSLISRELRAIKTIKPYLCENDLFIDRIMSEEIKAYDARLR